MNYPLRVIKHSKSSLLSIRTWHRRTDCPRITQPARICVRQVRISVNNNVEFLWLRKFWPAVVHFLSGSKFTNFTEFTVNVTFETNYKSSTVCKDVTRSLMCPSENSVNKQFFSCEIKKGSKYSWHTVQKKMLFITFWWKLKVRKEYPPPP